MIGERAWTRIELASLTALILGAIVCVYAAATPPAAFYRAWLCAYVFWLGVPLGALTLVLVHDLTGGDWMALARPSLAAAIATMPIATLAGIPVLIGLRAVYPWPDAAGLGNAFYLNSGFFALRYAIDVVLWNGLAAYALWMPRGIVVGVPPALSWISAVGLLLLAFTASFAAIDWILSLDPHFWSAVFPMIVGAHWFNTGLAFVLVVIASQPAGALARDHLADLAALLLATVIFWAYAEFCQFLIVWEENLTHEIPWYLHRIAGLWRIAVWFIALTGFFIPFFVLLWRPSKRSPAVVISVCALILVSRLLESWWLVLPEFPEIPALWLEIATLFALGGAMLLLFLGRLRLGPLPVPELRGAR